LLKRFNSKAKRRVKWVKKGEERISRQLDIVKFLKRQMVLETLMRIQFSPLERYLARHHYQTFVIDAEVSSDAPSSDESHDEPLVKAASTLPTRKPRLNRLLSSLSGREQHLTKLI